MNLLDTHSHIYLADFDVDREQMLQRAEKEGVRKILMPAIDSDTHSKMLETAIKFNDLCFNMMGLHPCSIKEDYKNELKIVEDYLQKKRFYGIGETGLDYYWDTTFKDQQKLAFKNQIEWGLHYDLPVVIHSRNSIDDCIEMIRANQKGNLKGVFHCFTGNSEQAKNITDLGFHLGIGGVVTYKNSGLDIVLTDIDPKYLVLETDAPYLTPVPFRGKRNEPAYLKYVLQKLSEVKQISEEELAEITTKNATELFGI